jgi:hypothetical protein
MMPTVEAGEAEDEYLVDGGERELAVVLAQQLTLNPACTQAATAQDEYPLLRLLEDLRGRRVGRASTPIRQAIRPLLLITSDPKPEGMARDAVAKADETGILGLFKQLNPAESLRDSVIHSAILH